MSLVKKADEFNYLDPDKVTIDDIEGILALDGHPEEAFEEEPSDLEVSEEFDEIDSDDSNDLVSAINIDSDPEPEGFVFTLPFVPGAALHEEDLADEIEVDEPEEDVVAEERDLWDYGELKQFLPWLNKMFSSVPGHSGHDTAGIERAIAYLNALDKSISRAVRSDIKNELDIAKIEDARKAIHDGIDRLEERLERLSAGRKKKNKKKADEENGLVKEAQKITGVSGVMVTVPLLISRIARVCINGHVSAGHDIEELFAKQVDKYKLTDREQAETLQLLEDMGYPVRRDRLNLTNEKMDIASSDNGDWAAQYYA